MDGLATIRRTGLEVCLSLFPPFFPCVTGEDEITARTSPNKCSKHPGRFPMEPRALGPQVIASHKAFDEGLGAGHKYPGLTNQLPAV